MQAAANLTPSCLSSLSLTIPLAPQPKSIQTFKTTKCTLPIKAVTESYEASEVDYSSRTSVFPAEACEILGGDACDVEMYPEAKLKQQTPQSNSSTRAPETVDREYIDYDNNKTVFPGEACDDLGGEFCEPEYRKGVY